MASRTTKRQVEGMFRTFCDVFGLPMSDGVSRTPGTYFLDCATVYGGWKVARHEASGTESDPFGWDRRSAREMWDAMHFAVAAHNLMERQEGKKPRRLLKRVAAAK